MDGRPPAHPGPALCSKCFMGDSCDICGQDKDKEEFVVCRECKTTAHTFCTGAEYYWLLKDLGWTCPSCKNGTRPQIILGRGSSSGANTPASWCLTVELLEGSNLAPERSNLCVVMTCNSKLISSSIKFQEVNPQWNEMHDFGVMDEPPSAMGLNIYRFDGPFDKAALLSHTEIQVKKGLVERWFKLSGESSLHLCIFLGNTRDGDHVKESFHQAKMRDRGKAMKLRRFPNTNAAVLKFLHLPDDDFMIDHFFCCININKVIQGRLFMSYKGFGFCADIFGKKEKFFFSWESIEDIKKIRNNGSLGIIVKLQRTDTDVVVFDCIEPSMEESLDVVFHSFASFQLARWKMMILWKTWWMNSADMVQIVEGNLGMKLLNSGDTFFSEADNIKMLEAFSCCLPLNISSVMELFEGGPLEYTVMENAGCIDYSATPWEENVDEIRRRVKFKMGNILSKYDNEILAFQQKSTDGNGYIIDENVVVQGAFLGDNFNVSFRYKMEQETLKTTMVRISIGIQWLKSTEYQEALSGMIFRSCLLHVKRKMDAFCDNLGFRMDLQDKSTEEVIVIPDDDVAVITDDDVVVITDDDDHDN